MHWAIWQQMKSPPKGFEDVVRTHFKQRQKHVSILSCNLVCQAGYACSSYLCLPQCYGRCLTLLLKIFCSTSSTGIAGNYAYRVTCSL